MEENQKDTNKSSNRYVVLDTETTGLDPSQGHRVIEIGCVEVIDRRLTGRTYHQYINPDREIDAGAIEVHGITNEFLADKPAFEHICTAFLDFVRGAELVIHNAPFDVGFLNAELARQPGAVAVDQCCAVFDTLALARSLHPGRKNTLDALCERYEVDNSQRELHGALLDAEILADVFLAMTSGQTRLQLGGDAETGGMEHGAGQSIRRLAAERPRLRVVAASAAETEAHAHLLAKIGEQGDCLWLEGERPPES